MGEFEVLDTDEPLNQRMERHAYDRLIMLSDGVFAIAITLAALEIRPPDHLGGDVVAVVRSMGIPLATYAGSFAFTGVYWMAHRRLIARMRRVDTLATLLNLALLAVVALQPLALQLVIRFGPTSPAGQLYFWQVGMIGLLQSLLWGYAAFIARLVDDSIAVGARWFVFASGLVLPVVSSALGLFVASRSEAGLLAMMAGIVALVAGRRWLSRKLGL